MNFPKKDGDHNINHYPSFFDLIIGKVIIISLKRTTNYAGLLNNLKRVFVLNQLTVLNLFNCHLSIRSFANDVLSYTEKTVTLTSLMDWLHILFRTARECPALIRGVHRIIVYINLILNIVISTVVVCFYRITFHRIILRYGSDF